ncbi:MAG: phosphoadenylyl-sulfate reductase [Cyanobacteriota bacterium]
MATSSALNLSNADLPVDDQGHGIDLEGARRDLEPLTAQQRLAWAQEHFTRRFALTTSFGIQAAVLLHMASELGQRSGLRVPVIWVDTGYLPQETYRYADQLRQLLELDLHVAQSPISPARMEALHGQLWGTGRVEDLELYHRIRKVEPLDRMLTELQVSCWASGVRGHQTDHRRAMRPLDPVRQRWSLRPLLSWTNREVYYYIQDHGLPQHPLFELGYSTVGDWHSSAPDGAEASGRATRFGGLKQECGIHLAGVMGEGI